MALVFNHAVVKKKNKDSSWNFVYVWFEHFALYKDFIENKEKILIWIFTSLLLFVERFYTWSDICISVLSLFFSKLMTPNMHYSLEIMF